MVALRVLAPNAIRPIEDLVPLLYPGVNAIAARSSGGAAGDRPIKHAELDALLAVPEGYGDDAPIDPDFHARRLPESVWRHSARLDSIEAIIQVHRLREVLALAGFTRLEPVMPNVDGEDRLGPESASLLDAIEEVLHQRHRASSAIEGFNAALRPYLYVHKGATQGFLDLFRAWFNLRTRRWGRHKGTSAHECLTGQRVHDWLTLLGCPPSPTLH